MFWMVGLPALDGRQYVYRVYAPADALAADLFWAAFHCHEEGPHPRASDHFDSAVIWRNRPVENGQTRRSEANPRAGGRTGPTTHQI